MIFPLVTLLEIGEVAEAGAAIEELVNLAKGVPRPLNSRALSSAAFAQGTLMIQFRDGTACSYDGVPESVYDELVSSSSPGSYYNTQIRGQY